MKKSVFILTIVLLLSFTFTLAASATKPTKVEGHFFGLVPGDPFIYCARTFDDFINGCVSQPVTPGLAQHGTFTGEVDGTPITCEYNLRAYDIDGIARFTMNRCTGELAGFHFKGVGWMETGLWEGSYHFDP